MAGLFPTYILRETDNDGKMLSGGRIYFYESGTYTPKTVYSDYTLSMPLTNPVVLDASGSADIWLGDGAYRVLITTSTGTQVRAPIDGITGTGGGAFGAGSNASVSVYKIYQDLRNDTNAPDVAYCCGATAIGDGGGGWFNRITTAEPDDNGICLVQGSTSYKRVFSGYISPEWYGVSYGVGVDQTYQINAAFAGSVRWNVPVRLTGSVYVSQNINIPSQASLYTMAGGYFVGPGPTAVQITLSSGSHIDGDSAVVFGDNIQPIFQAGVCDAIRLSWFGGDDDYVVWAKLDVASTAPYQVLVDRTTTLNASNLAIATNFSFKFTAGCMVNFVGSTACNVDIVLDHDVPTQIMSFASTACVGTINLHSTKCYMEWFGGSPANTGTSNAIPFLCCVKSKQLDLLPVNLNYTVTSTDPLSYSEFVTWNGNGSKITLNQNVTVLGMYTNDITIYGTGSITHSSCVATKTTSIVPLLSGPTSAINSILGPVSWLARGENSTLSGITQMDGRFSNCTIGTDDSINITRNSRFEGGTIQSVSNKPVFILSNEYDRFEFVGCAISCPGALFYCEDPTISVILNGCTNSAWSNGQAIHNGIATVHAIGCGFVRNSSVNSIDGVDLDSANMIKGGTDSTPIVVSSTTTPWRAPVTLTSDGTYIVTGENAALSSDPYTTQTIRAIASDEFYAAWRYGGVIDVDVVFPTGTTPDPDKRIGMMFVMPPTANVATVGVNAIGDGNKFCCNPAILGTAPWVRMPAKEAAPMRYVIPIWGGQIDMRAVPEAHPTYTVADIWGDQSTSVPSGADTRIPEFGRLVIYGVDDGVLIPAGTKIKASYRPVLPKTVQYEKFFPDHKPTQYASSDYYMFAPLSYQAIRIRTSLTASGLGQTQLAVPFMYRGGDYNGVQASLARKSSDPISPVQWNGSTLTVGWS